MSHFSASSFSSYYWEIYGCIRMVLLRNIPLSHIQYLEDRSWFSYKIVVSKRSAVIVLLTHSPCRNANMEGEK